MLYITQSDTAAGAVQYFDKSLKLGDYYSSAELGTWHGLAAERLGLQGEVTREQFAALANNRFPGGGKLTVRDAHQRRPGYDFCYSVPKSVSVYMAVNDDPVVKRIIDESVHAAMARVEQATEVLDQRNGGHVHKVTGNLVYAMFHHTVTSYQGPSNDQRSLHWGSPVLTDIRNRDLALHSNGTLETMSDELHKQLAALAAKLGVSVEHLWGVLVRQAYIDGLSSLVTVFCCGAAGLGVVWFFFYRRRQYKLTAEPKERYFLSTNEPLEYLVLGIILVGLVAVAGNNFYWVISDFFNPEFYALRHLPFQQ